MPLPTPMPSAPPEAPTVLRSRCRLAGALWGHAVLAEEHLDVRAWTVRGLVERRIPLHSIRSTSWCSLDTRGAMLQLELGDERLALQLRGAALWKLAIDDRTRQQHARPAAAPERARTYRHRALYNAPDFSTELRDRPVAPLFPVGGDRGEGYVRLTPTS